MLRPGGSLTLATRKVALLGWIRVQAVADADPLRRQYGVRWK